MKKGLPGGREYKKKASAYNQRRYLGCAEIWKGVVTLKVAMIGHKDFPSRSGGVEVMVGGLARSLAERGYDVTVYNRFQKFQ